MRTIAAFANAALADCALANAPLTWTTAAVHAQAPDAVRGEPSLAQLIEARTPWARTVSPDGRWLIFRTSQRSLATNATEPIVDNWVVATRTGQLPVRVPSDVADGDWSTDSRGLVIQTTDSVGTHRMFVGVPSLQRHALTDICTPPGARSVSIAPGEQWVVYALPRSDPSKATNALRPARDTAALMHAVEADSTYWPTSGLPTGRPAITRRTPPLDFFIAPVVRGGALGAATPLAVPDGRERTIDGIVWGPDGRRLAVSAYLGHELGIAQGYGTVYYVDAQGTLQTTVERQLYLANPGTGTLVAVSPPESAVSPVVTFSPSGHRVMYRIWAYDTNTAHPRSSAADAIAVADVPKRGPLRLLHARTVFAPVGNTDVVGWGSDERTGYVTSVDAGVYRDVLTAFHRDGRPPTQLWRQQLRDYWPTLSLDGRTFVALGQRPGELPQLFAGNTTDWVPHVVVSSAWLNPDLPPSLADYDTLSWTAPDGRLIWGHVLLPPGLSGRGASATSPLHPLLVCRKGGPEPMYPYWDGDCYAFPVVQFAHRGYVVLLPNVRSVDGEVLNRERKGDVATSYPDLMAGVDAVARRYPIDTTRMGIMGHSYGGIITSYTITQTNRFRAAVIYEGISDDGQLGEIRWAAYAAKAQYGAHLGEIGPTGDPWDPRDIAVMRNNDVIVHADQVTTPNLVETGAHLESTFPIFTEYWYDAMLYHHVPVEWWVIPRSGHGVEEPRLLLDAYERHLQWFDYWLCDVPYPDSTKQARYAAWIRGRIAASDPRWARSAASAVGRSSQGQQ